MPGSFAGVSNPQPTGCMQPRMAVNAAQYKITNLLKHYELFFVIRCHNVFSVWPKTTLLPIDQKRPLPFGGPETPKG